MSLNTVQRTQQGGIFLTPSEHSLFILTRISLEFICGNSYPGAVGCIWGEASLHLTSFRLILLPITTTFANSTWESLTLPLGLIPPDSLKLDTPWFFGEDNIIGRVDTIPNMGLPDPQATFKLTGLGIASKPFYNKFYEQVQLGHNSIATGGLNYRLFIAATIAPNFNPPSGLLTPSNSLPLNAASIKRGGQAFIDPNNPNELFLGEEEEKEEIQQQEGTPNPDPSWQNSSAPDGGNVLSEEGKTPQSASTPYAAASPASVSAYSIAASPSIASPAASVADLRSPPSFDDRKTSSAPPNLARREFGHSIPVIFFSSQQPIIPIAYPPQVGIFHHTTPQPSSSSSESVVQALSPSLEDELEEFFLQTVPTPAPPMIRGREENDEPGTVNLMMMNDVVILSAPAVTPNNFASGYATPIVNLFDPNYSAAMAMAQRYESNNNAAAVPTEYQEPGAVPVAAGEQQQQQHDNGQEGVVRAADLD